MLEIKLLLCDIIGRLQKSMFGLVYITLIIFNISIAYSQTSIKDSVYSIKEVIIESDKLNNFAIGSRFDDIDTTIIKNFSTNSVADLLSQLTNVSIKSNGVTGLATCSFRGTGAGHTAILWNGFALTSPMNGQIDLSIIPVSIADNIILQNGGAGALYGNGAIGGVIHLNNNKQKYNQGLKYGISTKISSYENYYQSIDFNLSKKRYIVLLDVFNSTGKNNFIYLKDNETKATRQKNADCKQYGIVNENYFKINDKQNINIRIWYQNNYRNLPPTELQDVVDANQTNESYRFSGEYQRIGNILSSSFRSGYFIENLNYNNYVIKEFAESISKTFVNELSNKYTISDNQLISLDINNSYSSGISESYDNTKHINELSSVISYKYNNKSNNFKTSINLRGLIIDNNFSPLIPSIGIEHKTFKSISFYGNISKNYRTPTLNDLYWIPNGNPDLKPENGWSEEIGAKYKSDILNINISGFSSIINDWIIWLPDGYIWRPQNVMQVWSRGGEAEFKVHKKINNINMALSSVASYTLSTNEKLKSETDNSLGKQLLYIPKINLQGNVFIEFKSFSLIYSQNYTGTRWIDAGNTQTLNPYSLGNATFGKKFAKNNYKFEFCFQVNNLWNVDYNVVSSVPMPLRTYQFLLKINYK